MCIYVSTFKTKKKKQTNANIIKESCLLICVRLILFANFVVVVVVLEVIFFCALNIKYWQLRKKKNGNNNITRRTFIRQETSLPNDHVMSHFSFYIFIYLIFGLLSPLTSLFFLHHLSHTLATHLVVVVLVWQHLHRKKFRLFVRVTSFYFWMPVCFTVSK